MTSSSDTLARAASPGVPIDLADQVARLKEEEPKLRIRDQAIRLGVSELDLVALKAGAGATRLSPRWNELLFALPALGQVMALTRNESAVHEKVGTYPEPELNGHAALFLSLDIDLRLFLSQWKHLWAVTEGERSSLQVFDRRGGAIHKIYLRPESDRGAYDAIVATLRDPATDGDLAIDREPLAKPAASAVVDIVAFREAWDSLKDTHEFFGLLRKFGLRRTDALGHGGPDRALKVGNDSLRWVLTEAAARQIEIMVFVGNPGAIQIHTGPITRVMEMGPWFNVLDPGFNLHLREPAIDTAWVVRKPTVDGVVTALELYDTEGESIATLFGKRKPGQPEDLAWRAMVTEIPAR